MATQVKSFPFGSEERQERYWYGEHSVYALIDPRDGKVRYIGKTFKPEDRHAQHRYTSAAKPIGQWMQELADAGLSPVFAVLEVVVGNDAALARERELVELYRKAGAPLFNRPRHRGRFANPQPTFT